MTKNKEIELLQIFVEIYIGYIEWTWNNMNYIDYREYIFIEFGCFRFG